MGKRLALCRGDAERARLLDMSERVRRAERLSLVALAAAGTLCVPIYGSTPLLPLAAAVGAIGVGQAVLTRVRRPENVLMGCWLFAQLMIALAVGLAAGPSLYLLCLFIFPMLLGSAVFPPRAAAAGVVFTGLLMTATAFIANPHMLASTPFALIYPAATMLASAIPAAAVRNLDVTTRESAIVDQLTGTLNRAALEFRIAELAHQSALTEHQVAVVLGDLDRFKSINDEHGHSAGDDVLRETAARLIEATGSTHPIYRLGGEEFIVLLTDTDISDAVAVAQRLCGAIRERPLSGINVTMSFGVGASPAGAPFDYEQVFADADRALYEAKAGGRDRVCAAGSTDVPLATPAPLAAPEPASNVVRLDRRRPRDPAPTAAAPAAGWQARIEAEHVETGSWLVRDELEREHLLDLNRRIHASNRPAYAITFGAVIAAAFTYGWITLIPPALAAIFYNLVESRLERKRRPEFLLGGIWMFTQAANALGIALVHFSSPHPPLLAPVFMLIMVVGTSAVFPRRGVAIGVSWQVLMTFGAAVFIDPSLAAHSPGLVALPLALVTSAGLIGYAAGRSAIDHRGAAVVDNLTGLLNRGALAARSAELAHHALATGQQVAVVVADLDHFKSINDQHGHATGDKVLQEAAYRLRKGLRAFEAAYRVGGEEFVILLPGVGADDAVGIAQRTCETIRQTPIAGIEVTMCLGVATTRPGEPFRYDRVFAQADAALYEAKRSGRDRVCWAEPDAASIAA